MLDWSSQQNSGIGLLICRAISKDFGGSNGLSGSKGLIEYSDEETNGFSGSNGLSGSSGLYGAGVSWGGTPFDTGGCGFSSCPS